MRFGSLSLTDIRLLCWKIRASEPCGFESGPCGFDLWTSQINDFKIYTFDSVRIIVCLSGIASHDSWCWWLAVPVRQHYKVTMSAQS